MSRLCSGHVGYSSCQAQTSLESKIQYEYVGRSRRGACRPCQLRFEKGYLQFSGFWPGAERLILYPFRMAPSDVPRQLTRTLRRISRPAICNRCLKARRNFTSDSTSDPLQNPSDDLEQSSSFRSTLPSDFVSTSFDPLKASRGRKKQLPPSRCEPSGDYAIESRGVLRTDNGT
jgi:hypothetical protein